MFTSDWTTKSPNCSEHSNLSSVSHFSRNCVRPCAITGLANSMLSKELSLPRSSNKWKYWKTGCGWPGWPGTPWNLCMVSAVLSMPLGESAAVFAAPLTSPAASWRWNSWAYKSSAPGRPNLPARAMPSCASPSVLTTYGTSACSLTDTCRSWPVRAVTPRMPPVLVWGHVTKTVSVVTRARHSAFPERQSNT